MGCRERSEKPFNLETFAKGLAAEKLRSKHERLALPGESMSLYGKNNHRVLMRICILNDNFYRGSGITLVIQRLLGSSSFRSLEVFLAGCSAWEGRETSVEEVALVPHHHYQHFSLMGGLLGIAPELIRLAKWVRETRCELIHVHHRRLAVYANLVGRLTGIPVLFTGHLTFPRALWFRYLAPEWMTAVSPSVATYLKQHSRVKDLSIIHNPLQFEPPSNTPHAGDSARVISIGRLDPVKGHATLIEAWSLLKQAGVQAKLDIYGEGPLRAPLASLIRARGLNSEVRLCGFAPDIADQLPTYAFNVLVSSTEGFPNAVIESASRGIPSLLNDVEGSRDTLPPGLALPNGLRYGDAGQLSAALATWLRSPRLLAEDGARFYQHLQAMCCPEEIGTSYVALYERMLLQTSAKSERIKRMRPVLQKSAHRVPVRSYREEGVTTPGEAGAPINSSSKE